uniref:Uncharacterized protein n=1 Tax=Picea glauca TaxID=3330 RepID=A0A101LVY2_PICGL|nr:hypothetical protein ABT39_MTgene2403 [Picea glauca]KUM45569.1 hypothetical protein ABT39_MTgene2404 [Picea glauca]KUM46369.1 hypothetical protein ABT39_MTgene1468 [Picea glauca]QHR88970.1 hypothetical protein Q903MT_gene2989 [Picea sitchensis]
MDGSRSRGLGSRCRSSVGTRSRSRSGSSSGAELDQRNQLRNRKSKPNWLCPLLCVGASLAFAYGTTLA